MRLTFVDTTLATPPTGGSQTFLVTLCEQLVRRGLAVTVVAQRGPDLTVGDALRQHGTQLVDDMWSRRHLPEERAALLARWLRSDAPDLLVLSNCTSTAWLALPQLPATLPTMTIAHNDVEAYYAPLRHYGRYIDCAVGVSRLVAGKLVDAGGMPAERCRAIPYGFASLPAEQAAARWADCQAGRPLRIGYVGRIVQEQKRVLDFVPLAGELARRGVAFELHLIGDGSERLALEQALQSAGLGERVRFWGWLDRQALLQRFAELDVYVLMSAYEGLPVALLEAMAHALAPVVSRTASGNAEVVEDGASGFLVPVGDVSGFAGCLEGLAKDRRLLQQTRQAAWLRSLDFSVERMVERYLEAFRDIASPRFGRQHRPRPGPFPPMASCRSRYPRWVRKMKYLVAPWTAR
jgi:glycosyltransferase involved in cell wall biosynthesis